MARHLALDSPSTTAAGITASPSGERVVAASLRPDGSVRKERKVRPGFTPAEDIARYRPPATRTAASGGGRGRGVPGLGAAVQAALGISASPATRGRGRGVHPPALISERERRPPGAQSTPRAATAARWKTSEDWTGKDKGKATQALPTRVKADEPRDSWDAVSSDDEVDDASKEERPLPPPVPVSTPTRVEATSAVEEAEKRTRALRKKLRQAEMLSSRPARTTEEQNKVDGISALEAELAALSV
ncbi:hypothetical protein JCM3770_005366 [Rhodotorula araucariae]